MAIITNETLALRGTSYGQLQAMIARRLGRNSLSDVIPNFISLAESRLYSGSNDIDIRVPSLRITPMLATETQSLAALPAGFLAVDRITVPDGSGRSPALSYLAPAEFADLMPGGGHPRYYTIADGLVQVEGGQPAIFTMSYYRRFASLIADADTNWLLENCPAVYLYGALIEAYQHIRDDMRLATAVRQYAAAINGLIETDESMRYSGSTLTIGSAR